MNIEAYRAFFRYPLIFWDRPELSDMSPKELNEYIDSLRRSDEPVKQEEFRSIIRRFLERGSCSDGKLFFSPGEIRASLEGEIFYCMDSRGESLWRDMVNLPESFRVKRKRDGQASSSESCS
ncbi:MAG: hypothetical protein PHU72_07890 [Dethiosulfovibrio sp.]|nr:hypothetical protein [Dethiosulfovibrio sp.]